MKYFHGVWSRRDTPRHVVMDGPYPRLRWEAAGCSNHGLSAGTATPWWATNGQGRGAHYHPEIWSYSPLRSELGDGAGVVMEVKDEPVSHEIESQDH